MLTMNQEENKRAAKRGLMIQTEHEGRKKIMYKQHQPCEKMPR